VYGSYSRDYGSILQLYYFNRIGKKRLDLITEFLLWQSTASIYQREYDCDFCQSSGRYEKRVCYHPSFGNEANEVEVSQVVYNDDDEITYDAGYMIELTAEDICTSFIPTCQRRNTDLSAMKILQRFARSVCPKSLITRDVADLIEAEAFCREYHVTLLGADVGYLDYPLKLVEAFGIITVARERVKAAELKRAQKDNKDA
jgi:hypothetical protein